MLHFTKTICILLIYRPILWLNCTTIFQKDKVHVFNNTDDLLCHLDFIISKNKPIFSANCNKNNGLCTKNGFSADKVSSLSFLNAILFQYDSINIIEHYIKNHHFICNLYQLRSIYNKICYLHVVYGSLVQSTFLIANLS